MAMLLTGLLMEDVPHPIILTISGALLLPVSFWAIKTIEEN